jgi:multicomponent Na+:H+ antiporter subunit C
MTGLFAVLAGALFGAGFFLLLQRSPLRLILGIVFISHAANVLIFVAADLTRGVPALIPPGERTLSEFAADPLPQALVLTAIVIGFGLLAYLLGLFDQLLKVRNVKDLDALTDSESDHESSGRETQ